MVDRSVLRGGGEPSARLVRNARNRPLLERGDESVLGKLLSDAKVPYDPSDTRNDPGGFDSPDGIDGAMGIGRRHRYPSYAAFGAPDCYALAACCGAVNNWRISVSPSQPGQCL